MKLDFPIFASTKNGGGRTPQGMRMRRLGGSSVLKSVKDALTESLSKNIPPRRHFEIGFQKAWCAKKAYMSSL